MCQGQLMPLVTHRRLSQTGSLLLPFNLCLFFLSKERAGLGGVGRASTLSEVDSACIYLCSEAERAADSTM